ncbi:hypothetical protein P171DRAFT_513703 [Karstenula rhodostoma CBS 690.94]|uniref:CorA-like transporter domain-containing protein n=1 Tax=Karstenula rhodostoma CBS 690.94 TaxID=1392251 RepID=A0A9P4PIM5_9PLEO|nr:hypothetical protein P171DRAFT_513703 [Karstenula rhodostoma CBS 690.94]
MANQGMTWAWDEFDTYRLAQNTLEDFLTKRFGYYNFFTRVVNGVYKFWIPRALTEVSPSFLDFVYPFGDQENAQDFYFSGFKDELNWQGARQGCSLPSLGRSGSEMRLSFNLRSVEVSARAVDFPWSVRQLAIYHVFDFESGKSTWITLKGNTVIKKRISRLVETSEFSCRSIADQFSNALRIHLLLCDWSVENWRWYINDLENSLRGTTRGALSANVDHTLGSYHVGPEVTPSYPSSPTSPRSQFGSFPHVPRVGTSSTFASPKSKPKQIPHFFSRSSRTASTMSEAKTVTVENDEPRAVEGSGRGLLNKILMLLSNCRLLRKAIGTNQNSSVESKEDGFTTSPERRREPEMIPPGLQEGEEMENAQDTKFSDLQRIQYIEGKVHEVSLVLKLNIETLGQLVRHYSLVMEHGNLSSEIRTKCQKDITEFASYVGGAQKDLQLQLSRTDTLARLQAEQKTFLYGILQYQSMRSSELFAKKAHESALNMEALTNNMNDLAQKTKQETVSMRIITLVTLFFLPGTFIGTFMSTDIIKFGDDNEQHFQWKGLKLYLEICFPLMLLTFFAWFIVYKYVNRERNRDYSRSFSGYAVSV